MSLRVLISGGGTGGHVNPAIAIANTVRDNVKGAEIAFVGTNYGIENKLVPQEGYKLYHVDIQGIKRKITPANIKTLYLAFTSVFKAKKLIREFKPDLVIGTGGYVCWPVLKAASQLKIPTALHESNAVPGLVVRMLEKYVDKIFINFDETRNYLKFPLKAMRVGNPVKNEYLKYDYQTARRELGIDGKYKIFILSCGGSMGAERINDEVINFMDTYVKDHPEVYHVHATGAIEYEAAKKKYQESGLEVYDNIELLEYIYDMPRRMAAADIVINRAGSMTLAEMAILKKTCLLIPSPNVTDNHQVKNAKVFANQDAAVMLEERELTENRFSGEMVKLIENEKLRGEMSKNISQFAVYDTCKIIYNELMTLAKKKKM